jgi:hypothetical protein
MNTEKKRMKPVKQILLGLSTFGLIAAVAHADDSFEVTKNGIVYLCQAETSTNPGGNAADCANDAYSGPYSRDESLQLCQGARNNGPAECGKKAYAGPYSKVESIQLCIGARDVGPADCGAKAYAGPFSKAETLLLCARGGSVATADCAIRAYAGPYSKQQAIDLCRSNPELINVALRQLHSESTMGFASVMQKSLSKAALRNELEPKLSLDK